MSTLSASGATVRNFQAAAAKILKAAQKLKGNFGPGLRMIAEEILTDVKKSSSGRGVPVASGALRDSGRAEGPVGPPTYPEVEISFGGASAPYALIQHEVLTFHHPVGEARYLVRGMERWKADSSQAMAVVRQQAASDLNQDR